MQNRVVLEELNRDLSLAKARVDAWAQATVSKADELKETQRKTVQNDREQVDSLKAAHEDILKEAARVKERLEIEEGEAKEAQSEVNELQTDAQRAEQELSSWREKLSLEQTGIEEREKDLAFKLDEARTRLMALESEIQKFQGSLGLTFVPSGIDSELLLVFTYVNPQAHDQEFTVGIRILKDKQYEVTCCRPELPNIEDLAAELNRTGEFRQFVRQARTSFQQTL